MTPLVIDDDRLRAELDPAVAVATIRRALVDAETGTLVAPPRVAADLGPGRLVFTAGARVGDWFGYRSYDTLGTDPGAQVVVLQDWRTGLVKVVAIGSEIGPRRTGAIGGAAADALARPGPCQLGLVGAGTQAWTQLWAISAVRPVTQIRVWSRGREGRERFARRAAEELGLNATPADSAEQAVRGAGMVVLATNSAEPVIDAGWVEEGAHVTSLGPKQQGRAEFGQALAERADVLVTDSLAQASAYQPPFVLEGTQHMGRLVSLGSVIKGSSPGRTEPAQVTLFCSVGLAGTEAYLLADMIRQQDLE